MNAAMPPTKPTARSVPMKVLVLGFCRTGTASMRAALKVLGYGNPHHIGLVMSNPAQVAAWNAAIDAKFEGKATVYGRVEWDALLGEFQAVADVPGILFAEELVRAYPDAQVILTTRDPERWWKSFCDTLLIMLNYRQTRLARWLDPHGYGKFVPFARRNLEILLGPLDVIEEAEAKRRYAAYYAGIQALVPPDRLLEYKMGEGWGRLCGFLGKGVPDVAFPHKNEAKMIMEGSRRQMWGIYWRAAVKVLAPSVVLMSLFIAIYIRA
ncbi:P-loop containing nucleoside triphosphate hydrolase protein [Mycena latifolia]|nr:P-loop containing nucleoside triphosphate hydrolase protein [Mycena latifolia]